MPALLLGVSLQPRWPLADGTAVLRAAGHAEELGFDHVAVGNRLLDSGSGLDTDPLVLLSAVSAASRRLRLLTSVLVAPYYPALVLANQAATLDVLSGGRLILGVGAGWNPQEFGAVGVPSRERGARTDDHLAAARALWSQRPANYAGQFTTLHAARLGVPPVTPGGPPVWVGGHSNAALRRALRFGDGWYGTGLSAAGLTSVRRRLRELADGAGNAERLTLGCAAFLTPPGIAAAVTSPGRPLGGTAPTAASVVDDLGHLAEAGLTACTAWLPVAAEHMDKAMEWRVAEVMPQLTGKRIAIREALAFGQARCDIRTELATRAAMTGDDIGRTIGQGQSLASPPTAPYEHERHNSVIGLPAPLRILCGLTSGSRQPCRPVTLGRQQRSSALAVGREPGRIKRCRGIARRPWAVSAAEQSAGRQDRGQVKAGE